ncbi:MAG: hypothetical protein ACJAYV_002332 [Oleispira sp.]|jgi:hypothetical protein
MEYGLKSRFLDSIADRECSKYSHYWLVIASQAVFFRVRRFLANREA